MMLKARSEKQAMHCIADIREESNKTAKVISIELLLFVVCFFFFKCATGLHNTIVV